MNDTDRIKIADAMGWIFPEGPMEWACPPNHPDPPGKGNLTVIPDPYTDANEDYSVLEWMRIRTRFFISDGPVDRADNVKGREEWILFRSGLHPPELYNVGDYAKAALKVIENDS